MRRLPFDLDDAKIYELQLRVPCAGSPADGTRSEPAFTDVPIDGAGGENPERAGGARH
jgi:hypothetical protein